MGKKKGKMSLEEAAEKYGNAGGNDFFRLSDDGETAKVRFLYEGEEDLDWYIVHETEINGKKRWVLCLQDEDCPFCNEGKRPVLKLFLQLQDLSDEKIKTWERGKTFVKKMLSLINRYEPLHDHVFEIERQGKKNDPATNYDLFHEEEDEADEDLLNQKQDLVGSNNFILDLEIEDLERLLEGTFSLEGNKEDEKEKPKRRKKEDKDKKKKSKKKEEDEEDENEEEDEEDENEEEDKKEEKEKKKRSRRRSRKKEEDDDGENAF